jgi:hypothetical protein
MPTTLALRKEVVPVSSTARRRLRLAACLSLSTALGAAVAALAALPMSPEPRSWVEPPIAPAPPLALPSASPRPAPAPAPAGASVPAQPPTCPEAVVRSTVARSLVESWAGSDRQRGTRIVPTIHEGRPRGFKVYAIRPGSPHALLGFHNGDTIRRIDGIDLTSAEAALDAYARVIRPGPRQVTVELTRRVCPVVLLISVA